MPRARLLKPGFFKNVTLASLSPHHRLLFEGLWTLADREGRLKDEPVWIKAEVFPYEPEVDVNGLLIDLQHAGFIVRYAYGDKTRSGKVRDRFRAIAIPTFFRHQTPHHREAASVIPAPTSKRSHPIQPPQLKSQESPRPARGQPESSRTVPVPVPVYGDPVPDPVTKEKSSAADAARRLPAPETPNDNLGVITKLAHDAIGALGPSSLSDLVESVKERCAELHIAYDSLAVKKAIDSALFQRQRPVHA